MRYRVIHTTKYAYTAAVPVCQNKVHLAPRTTKNQTCSNHQLFILPEPTDIDSQIDSFGNRVDYFSVNDAHRGLSITATSHVDLTPLAMLDEKASTPWEKIAKSLERPTADQDFDACLFRFPSLFVKSSPLFAEYARVSFTPGRPILEAMRDLTHRIFEEFKYIPGATSVSTPVETVFKQKTGVCQDFAHLQIACLRSLGLAARYVSGYLRTISPPGKPRLLGSDASHAWLSIFSGPNGWVDFDPTNDLIPSTDHITVAYGRDYGDVCPIQGVFVGGGDQSMAVSVQVEPLVT